MAKLSSLFKFEGTVGDFTVTKNSGFIRRKGGLSKERIATDPKLARVRENNMEFAMLSAASKVFREAFMSLKQSIRVQNLNARLSSKFVQIKKLDGTSARGYREVAKGMLSDEAKNFLNGFSFNEGKTLKAILQKPYVLDKETGVVTIDALAPSFDVLGGIGSGVVAFKAYWAKIDFATGTYVTVQSNEVKLKISSEVSTVELVPASVPTGDGIDVFVLSVMFFQNVNGIDYPLQNGEHNVADIIGVA